MSLQSSLQSYLNKSKASNEKKSYMSWFTSQNDKENLLVNNSNENVDDDDSNNENGWYSNVKDDPWLPTLTKSQRLLGFVICLCLGLFCFLLSSVYIPVLLLKSRKFVLLFSMGSVFTLMSFSLLWGPHSHMKHLLSRDRIYFTTCYIATLFCTLYFALWIKSVIFTLFFAILQIATLLQYIISYIPGGKTGIKYMTKICYSAASKTVEKTLPV